MTRDLDTENLVSNMRLESRLATSLDLDTMIASATEPSKAVKGARHGLGRWNMVLMDLRSIPTLVAAPEDDPGAGCSIWHGPVAGSNAVTAEFQHATHRMDILFLDPETGEAVTPARLRSALPRRRSRRDDVA